jgi:hypothetical protein
MAQEQLLRRGNLLMPLDQVREIVDIVRGEEAVWFGWAGEWVREHRDTGIIRLPLTGQVRHLDLTNPDQTKRMTAEREAVNFPIQFEASATMVDVAAYCIPNLPPGALLCNFTHDELVFDCPPITACAVSDTIDKAFAYTQKRGHWARLQDHYGRECPLAYKTKILSNGGP